MSENNSNLQNNKSNLQNNKSDVQNNNSNLQNNNSNLQNNKSDFQNNKRNFQNNKSSLKNNKSNLQNVWLRLSEEDKKLLEKNSKKARMSFSQYVMHLVESRPIIVVDFIPELVREINKIGVNINQISYVANSQKFVSSELKKSLNDSVKRIEQLRLTFSEKMEQLKNLQFENGALSICPETLSEINRKLDILVSEKELNNKWLL